MTNEIIFNYTCSYRGRWGDLNTTRVTVLSDFSDMTKWPYQIKVEERVEDSLDEKDDSESTTFYKISKGLFDNIKSTIARHQELTKLPEDINYVFVRDGGHMSFEFFCAGFKKKIYGSSLLTIGHQELEEDPNSQKYCAVLYRAYEEIKKLIDSEHPNIL